MSLDERMKEYEVVPKTRLMKKTPVIIRIDGKAFHTFTRRFNKPFDEVFRNAMNDTMLYLCKNIQGCVMGYTQSDEITLVLQDWETYETSAWFDYEVQKLCSISASMATLEFNRCFLKSKNNFINSSPETVEERKEWLELADAYDVASNMGAMFDSRCFNVPFSEVANVLIWRQQDATRNSIQSLAQSLYGHKEIQEISNNDLQNKMFSEKGVNWNDLPTEFKRGSCCIKEKYFIDAETDDKFVVKIKDGLVKKSKWVIDKEIPIFTKDRGYIENRLPTIP